MTLSFRGGIKRMAVVTLVLAGALLASPGVQAQRLAEQQTVQALHRALERLPQYGVFDFLAFSIDRGVVTLSGYTYTDTLKKAAERAARRVSGVDEVANRLEVLPASLNDDRIRRDAFYRIYTDSWLSRYASGGVRSVVWDAYEFGRFPGRQPFGQYPIRIIVNRGRITLAGAVDSASDRQIAEFRAREVFGAFGVTNELVVSND